MASFRHKTAAVAIALALVSSAASAQHASVSLTHTVFVTVPPRVKVQIAPAMDQQQSAKGQSPLAVNVTATRGWALVVGSKKTGTSQWVASNGDRSSSLVLFRNQISRSPEPGGAPDSEPVMLTVVAP